MNMRTIVCTLACGGAALMASAAFGQSETEWEKNTPYYEDDGWLDITEWFDGNDYNPTDEAWWRWDDEKYEVSDDTGSDRDSDMWYGWEGTRGDDWFYDFYDPAWSYGDSTANRFNYGSHYYDFDNDGRYDATVWFADRDGDGVFERYAYYTFNDGGSSQQRQHATGEAPKDAQRKSVYGTIQKVKDVQTRDATHTVVAIRTQDQDRTVFADLGKTSDVNPLGLKSGDQITVSGPMTKAGEFNVLLASSFETNGQSHQVDRQRRQITGTVQDTHRAKVRGRENLIAMIKTSDGQKMAVDLGPADQLGQQPTKGSSLTFTGVPVKVKDKLLVMAQSVKTGGQTRTIDRFEQNRSEGRDQQQQQQQKPKPDKDDMQDHKPTQGDSRQPR